MWRARVASASASSRVSGCVYVIAAGTSDIAVFCAANISKTTAARALYRLERIQLRARVISERGALLQFVGGEKATAAACVTALINDRRRLQSDRARSSLRR